MRSMMRSFDQLCLATCLLVGAQGCVGEGVTSSTFGDGGASEQETDDKVLAADLRALGTEELVRRVSKLPGKTVVIFDFDDTLMDHVEGRKSEWAQYSRSAIAYLKKHSVNIAICSQNKNSTNALNRRLPDLDADIFTNAFFASPAFQANTGTDKWDNIQKIMAYYRVTREDHVVFFDDNESHVKRVSTASDAVVIPVDVNGLDQPEFRDGMTQLLVAASGGGGGGGSNGGAACGDDVPSGDYCSVCGDCQEGEGDCDDDSECAPGLVCVSAADGGDKNQPGFDICALPQGGTESCDGQCSSACPCQQDEGDCDSDADCAGDLVCVSAADGGDKNQPGHDICAVPAGGTQSCKGLCSSACPCQAGEGDCDSNADCAGGLVCPPDGPGVEVCQQAGAGGGGGSSSGSGNLKVRVGSSWVSVGCKSGAPRADGSSDKWVISDRKLRNQDGVYLFCAEGWADGRDCQCSTGSSEAYHAITQADFNVASSARKHGNGLTASLVGMGPMYIFPNNAHEFCLAVGTNNIIENKDGGDDGNHHESTHQGKCNQWCFGAGCP